MKKLLLISAIMLFTGTLFSQEKFVVPELSDANKHNRMIYLANSFTLNSISYAKSMGKSVEDIAKFTGDQFKVGWDKENGFEGFVKGTLFNWACSIPNADIEILKQSDDMIKFKSAPAAPGLKKDGTRYNVSYEEFIKYGEIVHKIIGEYLGAEYSQEVVDDGMIVSIIKK